MEREKHRILSVFTEVPPAVVQRLRTEAAKSFELALQSMSASDTDEQEDAVADVTVSRRVRGAVDAAHCRMHPQH
jgi:hypothetical protein